MAKEHENPDRERPVKRTSSKRGSSRGRSRKKKKRSAGMVVLLSIRNFFIVLLLLVLILGLIGAGVVAGALLGYIETVEPIDVTNMTLNLTSFVYAEDENGNTVELERLYDNENRIWVDLDDIPLNLQNAFIAIEDERFYSHHGFDVKRTVGAAVTYVYKKLTHSNERTFGGSTITQQLIKNITGENDYNLERKIQEIYRAYVLENDLSKQEILEYYLNTIFLSNQCNGVSAAANTFFGKSVSDLTLAECASIAGITQSPTKYDPYRNPENNKEKQEVVLKKMLELGKITRSQYDEAVAEELHFVPIHENDEVSYQSYYVDAMIDQVISDLMEKYNYTKEVAARVLYNGGLKIYLAQDMSMQKIMDDVYSDEDSFPKGRGDVQPESAMVIMDPYTGQVKALVGGRGDKEGNRTLNRATQSTRQPGSTIKPISVYGPAIEYGLITPDTTIKDAPVTYNGWSPKNVDNSYKGNVSARTALAYSRNVPAVKVCHYLGVDNSFKYLEERMHISTLVDNEKRGDKTFSDKDLAPLALGGLTDGVSVLEMTAAYCSFVNDGFYNKPVFYTKVLDASGNVLLDGTSTHEIAMSEKTAYDMLTMMKAVVSYGSGTMANFSGMEIAGKTGTTGTTTSNDRWFIGCTPYYVGAVWFGYDIPQNLSGFSSNPAALTWKKVMKPIHENLEYKDFEKPGKEVSVMICRESGQRANPDCEHVTSEMYSSSGIPKSRCELHPLKAGSKNTLSEGTTTYRRPSSSQSYNDDDDDKDNSSGTSSSGESSGSGEGSDEASSSSSGSESSSSVGSTSSSGESSASQSSDSSSSSSTESSDSSSSSTSSSESSAQTSEGGF